MWHGEHPKTFGVYCNRHHLNGVGLSGCYG